MKASRQQGQIYIYLKKPKPTKTPKPINWRYSRHNREGKEKKEKKKKNNLCTKISQQRDESEKERGCGSAEDLGET